MEDDDGAEEKENKLPPRCCACAALGVGPPHKFVEYPYDANAFEEKNELHHPQALGPIVVEQQKQSERRGKGSQEVQGCP